MRAGVYRTRTGHREATSVTAVPTPIRRAHRDHSRAVHHSINPNLDKFRGPGPVSGTDSNPQQLSLPPETRFRSTNNKIRSSGSIPADQKHNRTDTRKAQSSQSHQSHRNPQSSCNPDPILESRRDQRTCGPEYIEPGGSLRPVCSPIALRFQDCIGQSQFRTQQPSIVLYSVIHRRGSESTVPITQICHHNP